MMASACVNNIGVSSYPTYSWFSPRISFSGDFPDQESMIDNTKEPPSPVENPLNPAGNPMIDGDFEFRLEEDPVTMLPADELFSGGKLVPLHLSSIRPTATSTASEEIRSIETVKSSRIAEISGSDPYLFSPKAPRCSSGWKELLRLKKIQNPKQDPQKSSSVPWKNLNPQSLKVFLHKTSKSPSLDPSLNLPLLKDSDLESVSIYEDLPRLSLNRNPPRKVRSIKTKASSENTTIGGRIGRSPMRRVPDSNSIPARGVSIDSPRMNSSGKVVFQSLERSSSSPSSFNGGPRIKHKGMERSYSANVRVTPVLNVPVCSLMGSSSKSGFGFGQLFSSNQKKDGAIKSHSNRNRTDRN